MAVALDGLLGGSLKGMGDAGSKGCLEYRSNNPLHCHLEELLLLLALTSVPTSSPYPHQQGAVYSSG